MISEDLQTILDEALSQALANPGAPSAAKNEEVAELVRVAIRVQGLAPCPVPRLDEGRHRFLAEAARCERQRSGMRDVLPLRLFRLALAAVTMTAALALIVGAVFSAGSILAGLSAAPTAQASTPTSNPSFTATPTQISLAPVNWAILAPHGGSSSFALRPAPPPNPAPESAAFGPHQAK